MKVLFLGDIVGRSGREALNRHLHKIMLFEFCLQFLRQVMK